MLTNINSYIISLQSSVPAALGVLALVLLAALGLGRLVDRRNPSMFVQFALGLNALAIAALLTFVLPPWLWGVILAGLAAWGLAALADRLRDWPLWGGGMVFFGVTMGSAFCPPYAWDEQVYQVSLILRDLSNHAFLFYPDNPYSAFPACGQVLMTLGVKLGGLNFPRLLVAALFVILFLWFYQWLKHFNWRLKYPLLLAMLLSPCILAMNRDVYMEIFIAVNLFAGVQTAIQERKHPTRAALLAGFFAGMAAAVKITAGGVSLAILILFWGLQKKRKLKSTLCFISVAAAGAIFFYAKSFLAAGNPVYPFASGWLKPGSADAAVETYHRLLGTHFYGVDGLFGVFTGWFFAIYDEPLFDGIVLGWQFLIIFLAAIAMLKNRRFACFSLAGLVIYFYWALTSQQSRFLLPLLFFAGYFALRFLRRFSFKIQLGIGVVLIALTMVSIEMPFLGHYYYCWKFFPDSRQNPVKILKIGGREPDYLAMLDFCSRNIGVKDRTMLLFERRTLYFPGDYVLGTPYFQAKFFTPVPENAQNVYEILKQNRITYLFIGATGRNPDHLESYDPENMKLTTLLRQLMRENKLSLVNVPDSGDYNLLRVN